MGRWAGVSLLGGGAPRTSHPTGYCLSDANEGVRGVPYRERGAEDVAPYKPAHSAAREGGGQRARGVA